MSMLFRIVVSLVFVGALAAIPGCGKEEGPSQQEQNTQTQETVRAEGMQAFAEAMQKKAADGGVDLDIDTDKEGITVRTEDGSGGIKIGSHAGIPSNWPKDIPIYQSAQVMMTNSRGDEGFQLMLQTRDTVAKVTKFYRQKITAEGWKEEQFMTMGTDMNNLFYSKGDRTVAVMVGSEAGQTFINITATN